jgi:excisionase family DNA binding protein
MTLCDTKRMKAPTPSEPELMTMQEVADFLRVTYRTIVRMNRARQIPYIKLGGVVRYRKADVLRAINRYTRKEIS